MGITQYRTSNKAGEVGVGGVADNEALSGCGQCNAVPPNGVGKGGGKQSGIEEDVGAESAGNSVPVQGVWRGDVTCEALVSSVAKVRSAVRMS